MCLGQGMTHVLINIIPDGKRELLKFLKCGNITDTTEEWHRFSKCGETITDTTEELLKFLKIGDIADRTETLDKTKELLKFLKCGAITNTTEALDIEMREDALVKHSTLWFFIALFFISVAHSLWRRAQSNPKRPRTLKEKIEHFCALMDQIFYQLKQLFKLVFKSLWGIVVAFAVATISAAGWNPLRLLNALWQVVCALMLCLVGRWNGQSNPYMCEDNALHIFQLLFSNTSLFYLMIFLISFSHFVLVADVTMLYFSPDAYFINKGRHHKHHSSHHH